MHQRRAITDGFDESEVTAMWDEAYDDYVRLKDKAENDIQSDYTLNLRIEAGPLILLGWFVSDAFPAMREGRLPGSPPVATTVGGASYGGPNYAYVGPIESSWNASGL